MAQVLGGHTKKLDAILAVMPKLDEIRRGIAELKDDNVKTHAELALSPKAAVQKWRLIAAEQGITSEADIASFLFAQTDDYEEQSQRRGSNSAALVAIALYQETLTINTRDKAPLQWAGTTENLGYAFWETGDKRQDALAYFRSVNAPYYVGKLEAAMSSRGLEP